LARCGDRLKATATSGGQIKRKPQRRVWGRGGTAGFPTVEMKYRTPTSAADIIPRWRA
jgi:hypothetical protein